MKRLIPSVRQLVFLGLVLAAVVNSVYTVMLWWLGFFATPQWHVVVILNGIGEQWVEGVLFHLLLLPVLAVLWRLWSYLPPR